MKKINLLATCFMLLFSPSVFGQITFEPGYLITEEGTRKEVLIRNADWKDNPDRFTYRETENGETQTATLQEVKEFGIGESEVFRRFTVDVDMSSDEVEKMSKSMNPEYERVTTFLRLLVEGQASLYQYESGNTRRFFMQQGDTPEQLIFKSYLTSNNDVAKNYGYKQQLLNKLNCSSVSQRSVGSLGYGRKSLTKFFVNYNECVNAPVTNYLAKREKRDVFNLYLRPGVNLYQANMESAVYDVIPPVDFENEVNARLGVEAEFVLPYNKGKWAILVEVASQSYSSETSNSRNERITVDYRSFEVPLGLRHYFFINEKARVFVNAQYVIDFVNSESIVEFSNSPDMKVSTATNFAFGAGFNYGRFNVEGRYSTSRGLVTDYLSWSSSYEGVSVIVGFRVF
ncbi:hypothetical protein AB9P05_10985 [Roseivirga sp. BDSF3-8]|uniref:hypothetical protein n=1 Tax=Roseivirga sp. BDSF3-8 TaxID=3241598 RepID=UPI003531A478